MLLVAATVDVPGNVGAVVVRADEALTVRVPAERL